MTYLATYDPATYAQLASVLPRFFKGVFDEPNSVSAARRSVAGFAVDVHEDEKAYTLVGNLPGFRKDDIKVEIDGNQVNIRAENPPVTVKAPADASSEVSQPSQSNPEVQARVLRNERYSGAFARGFSLPVEIDDSQSQAKYENGVLTLTLPKKPQASAKRLAIV
jgi:HSP20 family protein